MNMFCEDLLSIFVGIYFEFIFLSIVLPPSFYVHFLAHMLITIFATVLS